MIYAIKGELLQFFKSKWMAREDEIVDHDQDSPLMIIISSSNNDILLRLITNKEIENTLCSMIGDKTSNLDSFFLLCFKFYKSIM